MSALKAFRRTGVACAALLLSLAAGTSVAQAAPADGPQAGKSNASGVAPPPGAQPTGHVSPHARAARQRAEAQGQAAPAGIRVSAYTTKRKPHNPVGGR